MCQMSSRSAEYAADKEHPEQVEVVELDVALAGFIAAEHALGGGVAVEHLLQAALQFALLTKRGVDGCRKCDEDAELDRGTQQEGPDAWSITSTKSSTTVNAIRM